jgi:magnesium-transporting ATPase (P-type)
MVDQSTLTGESVPVDANPGDTVYAGALVRRGQAIAEVTATGSRTFFGRTAELVGTAHSASSEQAAIFAATRNLALGAAAVAARAGDLSCRGGIHFDPRSDQAAGRGGVQAGLGRGFTVNPS